MFTLVPNEILESGFVPRETLVLIFMLPIVVSIQGFARHIIGIRSLGLYAPIILTYAYFQLSFSGQEDPWSTQFLNGLTYGISLTLVVFATSYIFHLITKKLRLHYFPKIAIVLTAVSFNIYLVIAIANWQGGNQFLNNSILSVILISTAAEQFVSIMAKKNFKTAFSLAFTTMLLSVAVFGLMIIKPFQDFLLTYPYVLLLTFVLNYIIGRFTGLRLNEYFRFRDIMDRQ